MCPTPHDRPPGAIGPEERPAPPSIEVIDEYHRLLAERRAAAKRGEDTAALEAHLIEFMRAHGLGEEG